MWVRYALWEQWYGSSFYQNSVLFCYMWAPVGMMCVCYYRSQQFMKKMVEMLVFWDPQNTCHVVFKIKAITLQNSGQEC